MLLKLSRNELNEHAVENEGKLINKEILIWHWKYVRYNDYK